MLQFSWPGGSENIEGPPPQACASISGSTVVEQFAGSPTPALNSAHPLLPSASEGARPDLVELSAALVRLLAGVSAPRPIASAVQEGNGESFARERSPATKRYRLRQKTPVPPPRGRRVESVSPPMRQTMDRPVQSESFDLTALLGTASKASVAALAVLDSNLRVSNEEYVENFGSVQQSVSEVLAVAAEYDMACADSDAALSGVLTALETALSATAHALGGATPTSATTSIQPRLALPGTLMKQDSVVSVGSNLSTGMGVGTAARRRRRIDGILVPQ